MAGTTARWAVVVWRHTTSAHIDEVIHYGISGKYSMGIQYDADTMYSHFAGTQSVVRSPCMRCSYWFVSVIKLNCNAVVTAVVLIYSLIQRVAVWQHHDE